MQEDQGRPYRKCVRWISPSPARKWSMVRPVTEARSGESGAAIRRRTPAARITPVEPAQHRAPVMQIQVGHFAAGEPSPSQRSGAGPAGSAMVRAAGRHGHHGRRAGASRRAARPEIEHLPGHRAGDSPPGGAKSRAKPPRHPAPPGRCPSKLRPSHSPKWISFRRVDPAVARPRPSPSSRARARAVAEVGRWQQRTRAPRHHGADSASPRSVHIADSPPRWRAGVTDQVELHAARTPR